MSFERVKKGNADPGGNGRVWAGTKTLSSGSATLDYSSDLPGVVKDLPSTPIIDVSAKNPPELEASTTKDVGSISGGDTATFTVSVSGLSTGVPVCVSPPSGINADLTVTARATSSDTATVVVSNPTSGSIDPSSGTYRVRAVHLDDAFVASAGTSQATIKGQDGNASYDVNVWVHEQGGT